jgi:FAD:protein FMN transferase
MSLSTSTIKQDPIVKEFYVLGTIIQLKVYGSSSHKAIDEAIKKLVDIDDKMSVFKDYSEISKINKNAGFYFQEVSKETYFVLEKAIEYSSLSGGAFDPTIRPLVDLWGVGTDHARIPNKDEISNKLKLVNYKDVILKSEGRSIKLRYENQALDVGGIAKGFAADVVKNVLLKHGIMNAIIDLGGNIYALGAKPDGMLWNIGIQDPLGARGEYIGIVSVLNKSIVTSGNYERYFIKDGKKIHHILDPRTGHISENGIISVTIISDNSIDGDALTTCAYVLGIDRGIKLIEAIHGVEAVFITENKEVFATSGVKEELSMINKEYVYRQTYQSVKER